LVEKLKTLYKLQRLDSHLDKLEELRGDLPLAVKALEERLNDMERILEAKQKEKEDSAKKRESNDDEIRTLSENQKKYKSQLYSVRNNKEYDALTKEIDHTDTKIKKMEMENDALADFSKRVENEIEELTPLIDNLKAEMKEKEADLRTIIKANEKEEIKLREIRAKVEVNVKKPDYSQYIRIRKAKKGTAVSVVKRGSCSGCHNVVPAQRQLEIKKNNKLYTCEYCGRILISEDIAKENE
jgi:predicted  nucleic acid-binding Zn-ribbon protein